MGQVFNSSFHFFFVLPNAHFFLLAPHSLCFGVDGAFLPCTLFPFLLRLARPCFGLSFPFGSLCMLFLTRHY